MTKTGVGVVLWITRLRSHLRTGHAGETDMQGNARTDEQLREHYRIEKELADRLRCAGRHERRQLYRIVYDERSRRIPHHPLVVRAANPVAQTRAARPQVRLLCHFAHPGMVFMEIGAGDCAVSLAMTQYVDRVIAVDVSGELVSSARAPNFEFRKFNGVEFDLPAQSVSFAYSNDVLEHLHPEDAHEQLQNLRCVLQDGARYLCITPNRLSGPHDISRHFDETATGFHLKEYTLTELAELFTMVGFRQVRAFVSVKGYRVSPLLSPHFFTPIEHALARMPSQPRRKMARVLSAVKIIATK